MTENQPTKITYWQPAAGDTIAGVIQSDDDSLYDEQQTMLLQQDSGEVAGVDLNRYLRHSLKQNNAAVGDFVTVTFHGKEQKNSGRSFNRYTLSVDKLSGSASSLDSE